MRVYLTEDTSGIFKNTQQILHNETLQQCLASVFGVCQCFLKDTSLKELHNASHYHQNKTIKKGAMPHSPPM
jgi:hypothetical protein